MRYDGAQLPDLHVTLPTKFGVPVESVGDSKGTLSIEPSAGVSA